VDARWAAFGTTPKADGVCELFYLFSSTMGFTVYPVLMCYNFSTIPFLKCIASI
jgi:hypothetical protein